MIKKCDCVKFQKDRRTKLSKMLSGMSTEECSVIYLIEDMDNGGISTFHGPVKAVPRMIYGNK
jgi:hypothetical protein